ncbi:MAG: BREX-6 system phosphatase PglZ [Fuerstiella sp.]
MTPHTSPPATAFGPVSVALEADVREWLSRHNLVIWLDADNHYCDFVEQLIQLRQNNQLKYDVYAFRGSHLELMLELENVTGGVDKTRALIHLPGFNEETVKGTPLFELYRAGKRYRKALNTLVSDAAAGNVPPDRINEFLQRNSLNLASADNWLRDLMTSGTEGLASKLRDVSLTGLVDDLLFKRVLAQRLATVDFRVKEDEDSAENTADRRAIQDRIVSLTGMPDKWFKDSLRDSFSVGEEKTSAEAIAYSICSWAMCVSYVHDLAPNVEPRTEVLKSIRGLPAKVKDECHALVLRLQDGAEEQQKFYQRTADECELRLVDDKGKVSARALGRFDTFRFEEETILEGSLQAILDSDWETVHNWAVIRSDPKTFWLRNEPLRRNAWKLVAAAARLGVAVQQAGPSLQSTDSIQSAVDEYTRRGAEVDQAHRHLEQFRQKLWRSQIPMSAKIRECLDHMTVVWRDWADAWARQFNALCQSQGFLPEKSRQQRTLFDEEVKPLVSDGSTTAYFVVDALRYEMGCELLEAVEDQTAQTKTRLEWRLAELPSITEVGMNVLAPVNSRDGHLQPVLKDLGVKGFSTGEFRVSDPDSRQRAMHDRVGGRTCPKIELHEILKLDTRALKNKIRGARLVMVHSREIDNSGESGFGTAVFEDVLHQLRSAWHQLREAGVSNFVFAADHGFLLLDEDTHPRQPHGRKLDPKRRHIISDVPVDRNDEVRVSLRDLNYECGDAYVTFPKSIAVFDTVNRKKGFTHGGNSFQERVIPVLTVSYRQPAGGSTTPYDVTAVKKDGIAGMHCIAAKVTIDRNCLDYGSDDAIDLGLRVSDSTSVRVELCETRGGAELSSGAIVATVGEEFELFFRLTGNTNARVQVELFHPGADVNIETRTLKERFEVGYSTEVPEEFEAEEITESWLDDLPAGAIRRVFQHLSQHGAVTETEIIKMLGSAREFRKFARNFEKYAASAPFATRIDATAAVKRYVREGFAS